MASRADHCFVDTKHLSKEFNHVHQWLDELYAKYGGLHRKHRHHIEGVEEIRGLFGDEAAQAAEYHILIDMGHIPTTKQWELRTSTTMDGLGRRVSYLDHFSNCDDESLSIAYANYFPCQTCRRESWQRLIDIRDGRFYCAGCRGYNVHPEYRLYKEEKRAGY